MAYYGNNYYEREVIRERERPYDSYSGYPIGHHHHNNVMSDVVLSDVIYESNAIPSYGHRHHHHHPHGGAEIVERKEERIIYENDCDPYRRIY